MIHYASGAVHRVRHAILANFDTPSPLSHISDPPRFLVGLVQKSRKKALCTNSLSIVHEGFCPGASVRGSFVWKALSRVVLSVPPSVRIHLLQQKVKNHFKFHVSYV